MRSLYVQMIYSFGWSPEVGIFLGFLVFIFQLISGTLLYVNSQQRCVRVLALPLHTDYYLRKLDSYKQQLTLFSIDVLSIVPGKKDLEFQNQEGMRWSYSFSFSSYHFSLHNCLVLSLKDTWQFLCLLTHLTLKHISDFTCHLLLFQTLVHIGLSLPHIPIAITFLLGIYKMIRWRNHLNIYVY